MQIVEVRFTGAVRPRGTEAERKAQAAVVRDGFKVVDVITGHPYTYETATETIVTLAVLPGRNNTEEV